MRYLLILIIFIFSGCSNSNNIIGSVSDEDKVKIEKELIKIEQEQEKLEKDKYKYKPKYEKDGITYEVNEYNNGSGYQIYIETDEYLISTGTMPELNFYINKNTSTSTL